jgi:hypothetical protein
MSFKRKTFWLIGITSLLRCIIASSVELGNDEVYYRLYAQYLQWNYFDHPPIVGWLIRLTTFNLLSDTEFFIRLGAVVSSAIVSWILFLCGKKLANKHAGFLAALLYTATLYGSIIAGVFILPDSPQLVFWSWGLYLLIDITDNRISILSKRKKILLFGFVCGLGMLCKIHTSFLWFGFILYIIFCYRSLLAEPVLYISGIITILLFYPVIQWNIDNHFITYTYHSNRVKVAGADLNTNSFLTFTGGQLFYYNPVAFVAIFIAIVAAIKRKLTIAKEHTRLLLLTSMPLLSMAFFVSVFRDVLPHWTGPAYLGLILLAAGYFAKAAKRAVPLSFSIALLLSGLIITTGIILVNFYPGTLGKKNEFTLGDGDFTLDLYGWKDLEERFKRIMENDRQSGKMKTNALLISNKWFPAANTDYYIAMPLQKDLLAIGDTSDIHQYAWINKERKKLSAGDDAYCLVPSENYFDAKEHFGHLFSSVLPPDTIFQERNGKRCRLVFVYRFKDYKK